MPSGRSVDAEKCSYLDDVKSLGYTADSYHVAEGWSGLRRHARDQWLRAAQSIPLNIAEGNGKRSLNDRARFLDIAGGSALECAAIQDVLVASDGMNAGVSVAMKQKLQRILAMLTRMTIQFGGISEAPGNYLFEGEHEHEREGAGDKGTNQ